MSSKISILVASKNPVKLEAAKIGFEKVFAADAHVDGISVSSGVSDQPMSDEETLKGAINRVNAASMSENAKDYDFFVGMEGGIDKRDGQLETFAWITIKKKDNKELFGRGRTSTFVLPPKIAELIHQGMELGDADDIVFNHKNSKQKNGAVGILTGNLITRSSFYSEAVVMALIPFINEHLYSNK